MAETCPSAQFVQRRPDHVTPTLDTAGPDTITIGVGNNRSRSIPVTVQHNVPAKLLVTRTSPRRAIPAGGSFSLQATLYDGYGNFLTDDNGRR